MKRFLKFSWDLIKQLVEELIVIIRIIIEIFKK